MRCTCAEFVKRYGTKVEEIGKGTYGEVYTTTVPDIAIKTGTVDALLAEISVGSVVKGARHVMNAIDFAFHSNVDVDVAWVVYPRKDWDLQNANLVSVEQIRDTFAQVCMGVAELHARGIAHLDLKPPNVLCDEDGTCVVADLGNSATNVSYAGTLPPQSNVCTVWYRPPEAWLGLPFGFPFDIWSLGVMLVNLFLMLLDRKRYPLYKSFVSLFETFGVPSEEDWELSTKCLAMIPPGTPSAIEGSRTIANRLRDLSVPEDAIDLASHMLCLDPGKRWDIDKVLRSPYLAGAPSLGDPVPVSLHDPWSSVRRWKEHASITRIDRAYAHQLLFENVITRWGLDKASWLKRYAHTFVRATNVMDAYLASVQGDAIVSPSALGILELASCYVAAKLTNHGVIDDDPCTYRHRARAHGYEEDRFDLSVRDIMCNVPTVPSQPTHLDFLDHLMKGEKSTYRFVLTACLVCLTDEVFDRAPQRLAEMIYRICTAPYLDLAGEEKDIMRAVIDSTQWSHADEYASTVGTYVDFMERQQDSTNSESIK